jgi:hypothetical protein
MAQSIPEWWCTAVVQAIETYDSHKIEWTPPAYQRWHADTFGCIKGEAYPALVDALSIPGITGNETTAFPGQKAAYEFLFIFQHPQSGKRKLMYGKIALKSCGVRILILSAHNAERSSL